MWEEINKQIAQALNTPLALKTVEHQSGGSINTAYIIDSSIGKFFVKLNKRSFYPMFEAEAAGIAEIAISKTLRVPQVVTYGTTDEHAFLALEYVVFRPPSAAGISQLATRLAAMHRTTNVQYGWKLDNTIGTTPQINKYSNNWISFWRDQRLAMQIDLAITKKVSKTFISQSERLLSDIEKFFEGSTPAASLLHGDLWSGNYSFDDDGQPIIFDPAVYYGDRETDIAMTELFGGFPSEIYSMYHDAYPLDDGYKTRKKLYNLYHVINHFNLFGGSYLTQAESMIRSLLSEIK